MCPYWPISTSTHTGSTLSSLAQIIFVIRSLMIHTTQCTVHVQIFEECKFCG